MHTTLVSTNELAQHLDDPAWVILDGQNELGKPAFGPEAYAREHLPGARFISMEYDLADHDALDANGRSARGRHPLPAPDALAAVFSRLGIDSSKQVVVYDGAGGSYAVRTWWCLRWLGHKAVAVLDGGLTTWKSEGRPVTPVVPQWTPATFVARPDDSMQVDVSTLLARLGAATPRVVDARAAERYEGKSETIDPVAGHIPGAINRFWKANLGADGRFKTADTLRAEWSALLGELSPADTVHQCGSGVTACHNLLALEIAGLTGARLYPGSWSEWCADPARPVATGPTP